MKKIIFIGLFIAILALGTCLRFYNLGKVPDSLDWDEVALGYNAYSILVTGRDEYGKFLPVSFKSFGDYKPPLYVYITIPSVKVFGLTPFAVRFPSALLGSLSMVGVYFLVQQLFKKNPYAKDISLLSMLFFAISPWSIQFSRVAFEANAALAFVIFGSFFLIKGIGENKKIWLFLGILFFSLSMYTYHTEKLFIPLLLIGICVWAHQFFLQRKRLIVGLFIFFIICNGLWILDPNTFSRGTSISFSAGQGVLTHSISEIDLEKQNHDTFSMLFHNRRIVFANQFMQNYLSHFTPNWLFITGDLERHHAPGMADLYLFSLPTILLGLFFFIRRFGKSLWIILYWFGIAPVASALAVGAPHAIRSFVFLPTWQIFEAIGWVAVFVLLKGKLRFFVVSLFSLLLFMNFGYFLNQYFIHTNTDYEKYWQYGYKQAFQAAFIRTQGIVAVADDVEQPYIFYLFYNAIDPKKYLALGGTTAMLKPCAKLNSIIFTPCRPLDTGDWLITTKTAAYLHVREEITNSVGNPAVFIYDKW